MTTVFRLKAGRPPKLRENDVVKEHPILMSAPMILALKARRKFVTRRESEKWLKVKKGDHLWVRETWAPSPDGPIYRATQSENGITECDDFLKWKPSIHMPRWASRFTLIATADAYRERLQDITEEQAIAEGMEKLTAFDGFQYWAEYSNKREGLPHFTAREAFASLIDSLHGPGYWESNPMVTVIPFDYVEPLS